MAPASDENLRDAIAELLAEIRHGQQLGERRRNDPDLLELVGELRGTTAVLNAQLTDWRAENGRMMGGQDRRIEQLANDVRELRDWRWRTVGACVGVSTLLSTMTAVAGFLAATHHP